MAVHFEYVFETDEQDVPLSVTKEKAAEFAPGLHDDLLPRPDRRI